MASRMTSIRLRDKSGGGWAEWGRKNRAEMLAAYRRIAQHQFDEAKAVLEAADEDFIVHTYVGVNVERNKEEVHD